MAISLPCSCGKTLKIKEELAGRKIKCPACTGVLIVPALEPEIVETVVAEEPEDAPVPARPKKKKKAVVAEEPEEDQDRPRKKKKKKKKDITPLTAAEKKERKFEREREKRERIKQTLEGAAFLILGLVVLVASIYMFIVYGNDIIGSFTQGEPTIILIVVVVVAVGVGGTVKGALALLSVLANRGDDEDDI